MCNSYSLISRFVIIQYKGRNKCFDCSPEQDSESADVQSINLTQTDVFELRRNIFSDSDFVNLQRIYIQKGLYSHWYSRPYSLFRFQWRSKWLTKTRSTNCPIQLSSTSVITHSKRFRRLPSTRSQSSGTWICPPMQSNRLVTIRSLI